MDKWFEISTISLTGICLSSIGIYIAVIIFTRICGKRSFSKMSSFDFAMTIAVGSIIGTTILSSSVSLLEGVAGLASIFILQQTVAILRRFEIIKKAIDNSPLILMDGPTILEDNLRKARISVEDLRSTLRKKNVISLTQVRAVVFETTGDISVLYSDIEITIDSWLMKDVKKQ